MKQRDLIKKLEAAGAKFERHGHDHDVDRKDGKSIAVPRHTEISETLAKAILKQAGIG